MSLIVGKNYSPDNGSTSTYTRNDIMGIYDFSLQGTASEGPWFQEYLTRTTKSQYLKMHPTLYSINGDDSLYPIGIVADLRHSPSGTVGSVVTDLSNGNSPKISGPDANGKDSNYNNIYTAGDTVTFSFWNPASSTYVPVTLSYKLRDDFTTTLIVPAHTAGGEQYPYREVSLPGYYALYEGGEPTYPYYVGDSNHACICLRYADLYYSAGNSSWAAGYYNPSRTVSWNITPDGFPTQNPGKSIVTISNKLRSPFASLLEVIDPLIRPDSTYPGRYGVELWNVTSQYIGSLYPMVVSPEINFDDPNKSWVGTLQFCANNNPYGSLFGGGTKTQLAYTYGEWRDTCTVVNISDVTDWCDYNYIPEAWAPFGSWKVKLDDTFAMASNRYYKINFSVDTSTNYTYT